MSAPYERRARILDGAKVEVGRVVELTRDELLEIHLLADRMRTLSRRQALGWLTPFVQDLTRLNRLIHSAVSRSHAS